MVQDKHQREKTVDRHGASWMITYGDMVTLLLTFFVLVLVILNEAENNIYRMVNYLLTETENRLSDYVEVNNLNNSISVERSTKGVKITLSSQSLFDVNSAMIKPGIRPILYQIGTLIKSSRILSSKNDPELEEFQKVLKDNGYRLALEIRVEGHTDNWPIRSGKYHNNWELSSARALEVVKYLSQTSGIPEEVFSALGYGEFRPISDNGTPTGRAKNRRVEIYIDADVIKDTDKSS